MTPSERPTSEAEFAGVLRRAIVESGLSLERVRAHLAARGLGVSTATLSHWQSGRSLPERTRSLAAVGALEHILALEAGRLQSLLPEPRLRGRPAGVRAVDDDLARRQIPLWDRIRDAAARMDHATDERVRVLSLHETADVGSDHLVSAHRVRAVFVSAMDGASSYVAYYCEEAPHESLPRITPHRGVRQGRSLHDADVGLAVSELLLPAPLSTGTKGVFEYDIEHVPVPFTSLETGRVHPMRELVLIVRFHPDALPERIRVIEHDGEQGPEVPTRLAPDHSLTLIRHHLSPGVTGLRWSWPN